MEDYKKTIVVPWDFTERAEMALAHAFLLQQGLVGITIVHIVDKPNKIEEAKSKLQEVANKVKAEKDFEVAIEVRKGNIFKDMGNIAEDVNALMVVMGVHDVGKRGLKVVVKSPVPFLLVKDFPSRGEYDEIAVPLTEDKKNRVLLNWVIILSKYYNANINILKPFISNNHKNMLMRKQLFFVKKNLDSNGIVYGVKTSKREEDFNEYAFKFADEIEADMILLMSHTFKQFLKKVGNNKTPLMCVNPMKAKIGGFN